jgi:VWFA-related protein
MNIQKQFALFLSIAIAAAAQQQTPPQAQTTETGAAKFSTSANLVVELVTVKDKSGKPLDGLTAQDFVVTENGVPQTISFCQFQHLEELANDIPEPPPSMAPVMQKLVHTQIAPEPPGDIRYRDRRLMAMYFDMSTMPVPDQLRSLDAARKFIRTQMTKQDLMAIMVYQSGAVNVLEDFTPDRERLLTTINTLIVGEEGLGEDAQDASSSDSGSAFGQDDSEFNIFNTDRQLSALQTASRMLGTLNEKKALVYFASGLNLQGVNNQAQLHATVNAAIRANVAIYAVDARGLVASAPLGDATKGSPGGAAMYTGGSAMAAMSNFQKSQDTLWSLAADTGGKALLDFNDLSMGIVQAQKGFASYYVIGYYTSNTNLDGKFRRVKISLKEGLSASLDYRQGYYAGKEFKKFNSSDKERQLEDALMLADPVTELTIAMEVNYFQLNRAEYFVPITVKIPGSELALAKKGGAERTLIDFIGEVKDEYGTTITNVRDKVDFKLTEATAQELNKRHIEYDTGVTLLPGSYKVKFLARDAETGRIGTYEYKFLIPNLNKEDKRVPISSVVLSSQRVDRRDALYNAVKDPSKDKALAVNPLMQDGQMLVPSVTRVFSKSKDMYVYLQAYEPSATAAQPLVAFVSFYRGSTKAFETAPIKVTEGMNNKLRTMPFKFNFSLGQLPSGRYNCQVTVLDPGGQKATFWQAPVLLVQ